MRPQAAHILSYPPPSCICTTPYARLFYRVHHRRGLSHYTFFQTDFLMGRIHRRSNTPRAGKANVPLGIHTVVREPAWLATKPQTRRDPFHKAHIHLTPVHRHTANQSNPRDQTPKVPNSQTPLECLWCDAHHGMIPLQQGILSTKLG